MVDPDNDLDQFRIPQGSLFLELYCARNQANNNASFPMELYDGNGRLDQGRLAPARTIGMAGQIRHPVWRALITQPPAPNTGVTSHAFYGPAPISTTFEPQKMGLVPDRIVWFAPQDPTGAPEANMVFFGRSGTINNPGQPTVPAPSNVVRGPAAGTRWLARAQTLGRAR